MIKIELSQADALHLLELIGWHARDDEHPLSFEDVHGVSMGLYGTIAGQLYDQLPEQPSCPRCDAGTWELHFEDDDGTGPRMFECANCGLTFTQERGKS